MTAFEHAFDFVVDIEGGWSQDPKDRGNYTGGAIGEGELKGTKYGISAAAYPDLDIEHLTLDAAKGIYAADFWNKIQGDLLPEGLALCVFEAAVLSGPATAVKMLQNALGIGADGYAGPETVRAVRALSERTAIVYFAAEQAACYARIPNAEHYFLRGWMRRILNSAIEAAS